MPIIKKCNVVETKDSSIQRLTIEFQPESNTHFAALGSSVLWTCRFDSCHPHSLTHKDLEQLAPSPFFMDRGQKSKLVIALESRWFCVDSFGDVADLTFTQSNTGSNEHGITTEIPIRHVPYHDSIWRQEIQTLFENQGSEDRAGDNGEGGRYDKAG